VMTAGVGRQVAVMGGFDDRDRLVVVVVSSWITFVLTGPRHS
jgi:hypothetical protein